MGRPGETWVGWERHGKAGRDVGRPGETWVGRERHGKAGRDVGRLGETWVVCGSRGAVSSEQLWTCVSHCGRV